MKAVFGLLIVSALVSGCAALSRSNSDDVSVRAVDRQNAFLAGNYEKAYKYMSPGYRNTKSFEYFKMSFQGMSAAKEFQLKGVDCQESVCKVTISVSYNVPVVGVGDVHMERDNVETWVQLDGNWWFSRMD